MNDEPEFPPLASPHGGGQTPLQSHDAWNEAHPYVTVVLTNAGALRYALLEMLQPFFWIGVMVMSALLTVVGPQFASSFDSLAISLPVAWLICLLCSAIIHLFTNRFYEIEVTARGVYKRNERTESCSRWRDLSLILEFDGDIWIITSSGALFVPREAFASRELAHDFAALARDLKKATWVAHKENL